MKKIVATLIVALAVVWALSSCGSSTKSSSGSKDLSAQSVVNTIDAAKDLSGTWKADGFTAKIANGVITIDIVGDDQSSGLYWKGTFPAQVTTSTISSQANKKALQWAILGSDEKTKTFTYKDNKLSFKFSMMGVSGMIDLTREG